MDRNIKRIAYYLRKVAEYNAARYAFLRGKPGYCPPDSRHERLLSYKLVLNAQLEAVRGRCETISV